MKKFSQIFFLSALPSLFKYSQAQNTTDDDVGESPYWHDRYHGWLSMSAYGDYNTDCPLTFTSESLENQYPGNTDAPWTVITEWGPTSLGMTGYCVVVPEMNKTVMVFSGVFGFQNFNATPVPFENISCPECLVHADAYATYLEAKELTADWADMKTVEAYNGHIWSATGHGFGGMVAQIAAIDLGWRGYAHAVHSFGAPRAFNNYTAALYNDLFEGESGSRTVANNDSVPTWIPADDYYEFVEQGFHIWGTNSTYGQNYVSCGFDINDPDCLGGDNEADHYFYYTPLGTCGQSYELLIYNTTLDDDILASEDAAYSSASTIPLNSTIDIPIPTTSSSVLNTTTLVSTTTSTTSTTTTTTTTSLPVATTTSSSSTSKASDASSSGERVKVGVVGLVAAAMVGLTL